MFLQSVFSDRKKASNLEAYVEWFNRLSYLVATEICMVSQKPLAEPWRRLKRAWRLPRTPLMMAPVRRSHAVIQSLPYLRSDAPPLMSSCSP